MACIVRNLEKRFRSLNEIHFFMMETKIMKHLITILLLLSTVGCFVDQQPNENIIQPTSEYSSTPTSTQTAVPFMDATEVVPSAVPTLTPSSPSLPDGRLVFTTFPNDSLWVMDLPSLDRRLLYQEEGTLIVSPVLFPDGITIAFLWDIGNVRGIFDLYQGDIYSSPPKRIADEGGEISPDRKSTVFIQEMDQNLYPSFDLFKYDLSSDSITRLTSDGVFKSLVTWSPDGTKIAYVVGLDLTGDLAVIGSDGSNVLFIPEGNIDGFSGLAWSMDDEFIVAPYQNGEYVNLEEINIRTSEITKIESPEPGGYCGFPFFYSMENKVICSCIVSGSKNLFILDIDSGDYFQLTDFNHQFTLSTMINEFSTFDGDRILFLYRPGTQMDDTMDLYLVSIIDHNVVELTRDLDINDYDWILTEDLSKN